MDRGSDLDAESGRQQQQDAQQRRIGTGRFRLRIVVHDRINPRIRAPANRGPVAAANIRGWA
jgi:hypothetical protein